MLLGICFYFFACCISFLWQSLWTVLAVAAVTVAAATAAVCLQIIPKTLISFLHNFLRYNFSIYFAILLYFSGFFCQKYINFYWKSAFAASHKRKQDKKQWKAANVATMLCFWVLTTELKMETHYPPTACQLLTKHQYSLFTSTSFWLASIYLSE